MIYIWLYIIAFIFNIGALILTIKIVNEAGLDGEVNPISRYFISTGKPWVMPLGAAISLTVLYVVMGYVGGHQGVFIAGLFAMLLYCFDFVNDAYVLIRMEYDYRYSSTEPPLTTAEYREMSCREFDEWMNKE